MLSGVCVSVWWRMNCARPIKCFGGVCFSTVLKRGHTHTHTHTAQIVSISNNLAVGLVANIWLSTQLNGVSWAKQHGLLVKWYDNCWSHAASQPANQSASSGVQLYVLCTQIVCQFYCSFMNLFCFRLRLYSKYSKEFELLSENYYVDDFVFVWPKNAFHLKIVLTTWIYVTFE